MNVSVSHVDITNVEKPVETVENPLDSRKTDVENSVEEVEKKCIEDVKHNGTPPGKRGAASEKNLSFCREHVIVLTVPR